jgi:hypothetical protein
MGFRLYAHYSLFIAAASKSNALGHCTSKCVIVPLWSVRVINRDQRQEDSGRRDVIDDVRCYASVPIAPIVRIVRSPKSGKKATNTQTICIIEDDGISSDLQNGDPIKHARQGTIEVCETKRIGQIIELRNGRTADDTTAPNETTDDGCTDSTFQWTEYPQPEPRRTKPPTMFEWVMRPDARRRRH